ncbi:unnamed protein product [Linum trigynum]|uniref:Uncharacterized protein n=1 Tax=Linum trigynum TaxID=586398 RepID=A0AAV2CY56_9ROSI
MVEEVADVNMEELVRPDYPRNGDKANNGDDGFSVHEDDDFVPHLVEQVEEEKDGTENLADVTNLGKATM